jgi:hypothetical protein
VRGCDEYILICSNKAIAIRWNADIPLFQKKMVKYALAVLQGKEGRAVFMDFLTHISPAYYCNSYTDAPIVQDLGIMASTDPVAIDQASVDMVNGQKALDNSCLPSSRKPGKTNSGPSTPI